MTSSKIALVRSAAVAWFLCIACGGLMASCRADEADEPVADGGGDGGPIGGAEDLRDIQLDVVVLPADASHRFPDALIPWPDASDARPGDARNEQMDSEVPGTDGGSSGVCALKEVARCFRGLSFADCGGTGVSPRVWCRADDECLWFAADCPARGFARRLESCDTSRCLDTHKAWGIEPWTRERAATIPVEVHQGEPLPGNRSVECSCASGPPCLGELPFCNAGAIEGYGGTADPRPENAHWSLPSMVSVRLWAEGGIAGEGSDRVLIIEFDFYQATGYIARACLIGTSDADARGEPVCASDGRVSVSGIPVAARDVQTLHGRFEFSFPDFEPHGTDGETMTRGLRLLGGF
jgi:hypothetical protein